MTLEEALKQAEFANLSDQEAVAFGNNPGTPVENRELQTVAAIVLAIGKDETRLVLGTIKAVAEQDPLVDAFYVKLCSYGEDWADPEWQKSIDDLAKIGNWSEDTVNKLKAMGIVPRTLWEEWGVPEPTLEQVGEVRTRNLHKQQTTDFMGQLNAVIGSDDPDPALIKKMVAEWTP